VVPVGPPDFSKGSSLEVVSLMHDFNKNCCSITLLLILCAVHKSGAKCKITFHKNTHNIWRANYFPSIFWSGESTHLFCHFTSSFKFQSFKFQSSFILLSYQLVDNFMLTFSLI
jgi:hypothetical protein